MIKCKFSSLSDEPTLQRAKDELSQRQEDLSRYEDQSRDLTSELRLH